jgi:two-component system nitrogen regulation sensor histidine kinase NtrY
VLLGTVFLFVAALGREDLGAARIVAFLMVGGRLVVAVALRPAPPTSPSPASSTRSASAISRRVSPIQSYGSGFAELGAALDESITKLRGERHTLSEANRFYEAVLDDAPTALLTVDHEGKVELTNKAARRLLVKHKGVRAEDFAVYGDAFARRCPAAPSGGPRLVPLLTDGLPQTVMVSAAIVQRLGGLVRVVAVQPIQGELNAVEIAAQSDLIRVLTHEIMNSITPVTSLAHTAADLIASVDCGGDPRSWTRARRWRRWPGAPTA